MIPEKYAMLQQIMAMVLWSASAVCTVYSTELNISNAAACTEVWKCLNTFPCLEDVAFSPFFHTPTFIALYAFVT